MLKNRLWLETIREVNGCVPNIYGNMPCDEGMECDRCSSRTTELVYQKKLMEHISEELKHQIYIACCTAVFGPVDPEFDGDVDNYYEIMYDIAEQETVDYLHSMQAEMLDHALDDVE